MANTMSIEVASAKAPTHTVNFHVLPSTGVWSGKIKRVQIWRTDHSVNVIIASIFKS